MSTSQEKKKNLSNNSKSNEYYKINQQELSVVRWSDSPIIN